MPNDPTSVHDQGPDGLLDGDDRRVDVVLTGDDDGGRNAPRGTFTKVGSGMATVVLAIAATYVVPDLSFARPWTSPTPPAGLEFLAGERDDAVPFWNLLGREFMGEAAAEAAAQEHTDEAVAIAEAELAVDDADLAPIADREVVTPAGDRLPPYRPHPDDAETPEQPLELPNPEALDRYFAALARTDAGYAGAVTRAVQWGDSAIAADHVTSTLRAKLQQRFGDAGHGFHLLAKANTSYIHKGVSFRGGEDWSRCYIINNCKGDGLYGLGGTTVWSAGGATSRFETSDSTPNGRKASKLELWYRAEPKGGDVRVRVDKGEPTIVSTASETAADAWHTIEVPDDAHEFEVRAAGGGKVRLYGVVIERDGPGVVWDGMEQLGAFTSRMLNFEPTHLRDQVAHRGAQLVVLMFGGNDLLLPEHRLDGYRNDFRTVLQRLRAQDDPPACLVISPVDHGIREAQRIISNPMVAKITAIQREVAVEEGCAFFDSQAAMGGEGAVARWRRTNPPLISGDLAHLTDAGQKVIGHMIYVALLQRYVEYRRRTDVVGD
ncbi:MAG: hypothetical protein IPK74_29570 [Deltaproteobacteria bacterium]|nr:hypothetical protein [Deltaproteobacteria bacterium]